MIREIRFDTIISIKKYYKNGVKLQCEDCGYKSFFLSCVNNVRCCRCGAIYQTVEDLGE